MKKNFIQNMGSPVVFGDLLGRAVVMYYKDGMWTEPVCINRTIIKLGPNTSAFHYGQAIFEGMRAHLLENGTVGVFRPTDHWRRLNASATRMGMPEVPEHAFMCALGTLLRKENSRLLVSGTIPALYIRPSMINTEETFAPSKADEFMLSFTVAPLENHFVNGSTAWVEQNLSRADHGGVGQAKTAGNYGRAVIAEKQAHKRGFNSALWAKDTVQEFGTMTVFYVEDGILHTPSLESGLILPGITRRSIMTFAEKRGISVREADIETPDFLANIASGKITEVFGCGTATIISPYTIIGSDAGTHALPIITTASVSYMLYEDLAQAYKGILLPELMTM